MHSAESLQNLLSTYVIGAYALTTDDGLSHLQVFFSRPLAVVLGPRQADEAYKKPMLFWPIEFGWGYPDKFRYDLAIDRYGHSERVKSLFGGTESIKAALLQLDCYVEWNSFLYVQPPVLPEIKEYMQRYCEYC